MVKPKPTIMTSETQLSVGPSVTLCITALEIQSKWFAVPALALAQISFPLSQQTIYEHLNCSKTFKK